MKTQYMKLNKSAAGWSAAGCVCAVAIALNAVGLMAQAPAIDHPNANDTEQQILIAALDACAAEGRKVDPNTPDSDAGHRRAQAGQQILVWQIECAFDRPEFDPVISHGCMLLQELWPWWHEDCQYCQN